MTKFVGHSSGINQDTKIFKEYLEKIKQAESQKGRSILPWTDKDNKLKRSFSDCAEAHVWLELYSRNLNPLHYYCVAFNGAGRVTPCCNNCRMWVHNAFMGVVTADTEYNNKHTYSTR